MEVGLEGACALGAIGIELLGSAYPSTRVPTQMRPAHAANRCGKGALSPCNALHLGTPTCSTSTGVLSPLYQTTRTAFVALCVAGVQ